MKSIKRIGAKLCLLILFFTSCSAQPSVQKNTANSLLWEISGKGLAEPSYVYGTIHLICKEDFNLSESVKQTFQSSKQVFLEMDMDDPTLQVSMMQKMQLPAGETLKNKLGDANYKKLDSFMKREMSMSVVLFDRFKPMMVMSLLTQKLLPCTTMESFEMTFVKMAREQKKELLGLERLEDQIAVFEAIPDSFEIKSIMSIVNDFEGQQKEYTRMAAIYRTENIDSLYRTTTESPEMMNSQEVLLDRRNRNWIPVMELAMKQNSTFFAVGAAHLAGSMGVLELLRKQGYTVRPVRSKS
jgi:uncharacterized protein YbaP (TraB family)